MRTPALAGDHAAYGYYICRSGGIPRGREPSRVAGKDGRLRLFREIRHGDVEALFAVRIATRENAYTMAELENLGITPSSVLEMLREGTRGWLCEEDGEVVGFSMGNGPTGEMWVIAVLPDCEGKGIGARLLGLAEEWLFSQGNREIWLTTDVDTSLRAYGFYRAAGWRDDGVQEGLRYMRKAKQAS
jgi:ribosomal protein S18 acetylase RimI-like enzyme